MWIFKKFLNSIKQLNINRKQKLYIDKELSIKSGKKAELLISQKNDSQYVDHAHGIHQVDIERWREAQYYEKKTWMESSSHCSDDRNFDHLSKFDNYQSVIKYFSTYSNKALNIIELGCGPFTNIRLILKKLETFKISKIALLDPLIEEYLKHANCSYKNKQLDHFDVKVINSPIEMLNINQKYDLVVICNVLEHCYDVRKIFNVILNIINQNGLLIFADVYYKGKMAKEMTMEIYDAGHPIKLSESVMNDFLGHFNSIFDKDISGLYRQYWRNDKYFIGYKTS